tara:strand:- start:530 stop:745 length:216 start_codon:yes stop_codon:yes gene_type:complete
MKGISYEIIQRKKYDGYFIRRVDKTKIIHNPNNEDRRYETKYTSKNGMTWENALKQFNFLEYILPKKRLTT